MAVITFYIKYFCFLFLHTFSYYILFICELNWIIFPPTGFSSGTCATKFIYSAFPNGWAASTAGEGQSAAVSAASTTSAEPARSEGSGGGFVLRSHTTTTAAYQSEDISSAARNQKEAPPLPNTLLRPPVFQPPWKPRLANPWLFFFVVVILFSLLAQEQAMKLKP